MQENVMYVLLDYICCYNDLYSVANVYIDLLRESLAEYFITLTRKLERSIRDNRAS